jgi:beta-aspartyl-dipeptidase (metallo-type)
MFLVVENGEVRAPEPLGRTSILVAGDRIARIGEIDLAALDRLQLVVDRIDATGCLVAPGFIDPHEHLLGGSGESGWATQTPEIALGELVSAGITTVVGCLGTDTTTKSMPGLLAKAKAFSDEGLTALVWTGGYTIPPATLTGSIRTDMLYVSEAIGAGEIALADNRSSAPSAPELARIVKEAYVAGTLTGKAGVTHFHIGAQPERFRVLNALIGDFDVDPQWLYPTHVERSEALVRDAIALASRGATVDMDTVARDLPKWVRFYLDEGGDPSLLTASSDAAIASPRDLFDQIRACATDPAIGIDVALPLVTTNTARKLKLNRKGALRPGMDADIVVLRERSLDLVEVVARGRRMFRDGRVAVEEAFRKDSTRKWRNGE